MALAATEEEISGMELALNGERVIADARGCLYWPDEQLLVVSDLHLEKGSSFAAIKGMHLPPYDTHATLETLALCVTTWKPKTIVSLGDSFHDENAAERLPQSCRLALRQLMEGRDWVWVSGNHDPVPPEGLGGTFCTELSIGNLNFVHEPKVEYRTGEIAGHLHPAGKIRVRGKLLRRRCFATDGSRLILPAFGAFTGGLSLRDPAFDGLFDARQLQAVLLGKDALYQVAGTQLVQ